jgi:glutaconate CoA-transferase subunit A
MKTKLTTLEAALAPVQSGSSIALGGAMLRRQPNAAVRHLINRDIKDLTLLTWVTTTSTDLLAAAGCVKRVEGVYVGMFNHGLAPNFRRGVESGAIEVRDFSETAMIARFRAASAGLPFYPLKSLLGSDIAERNPEQFRLITCPYTNRMLHAVQAAETDFTIMHGYGSDEYGNVQWPVVRDTDDIDQMIATAAKRLIVTVERIVPHSTVRKQPSLTYIPGCIVEAVVEAPYGAHPAACDTRYDEDEEHLGEYLEYCRTSEGAATYLKKYVRTASSHEAYVRQVGGLAALSRLDVVEKRDFR